MSKQPEPTVIKKYANRRLYNTGTSTYVTLEDLGEMVKRGEDFLVHDAKTGEDITRSVLTQIIVEEEGKGQNLLPITFLRQLIRFYGDSLQYLVPTYLDFTLDALTRDQDKWRSQLKQGLAAGPFGMMEEHVRRNSEMFEQAMRMFLPFGAKGPAGAGNGAAPSPEAGKPRTGAEGGSDIDQLKRQLDEMRSRLDKLAGKS